MNCEALCIVLNKKSNPLKGILSYYNFFLNGEISKLFYNNVITLKREKQILLLKNDINKIFPEKIIFFICFNDNEIGKIIMKTLNSLNVDKACIIRGED